MKINRLQTTFRKRQYMISGFYELFYYNDTEIKTVAPHTHDYYEFYFFLEGKVTMTINNQIYELHPHEIIIIPPHTTHRVNIDDTSIPYRRIVLWIKEKALDSLHKEYKEFTFILNYVLQSEQYIFSCELTDFHYIREILFAIIDEQNSNLFAKEAQISIYLKQLLLTINRILHRQIYEPKNQKKYSLYEKILAYVEIHSDENLTLDYLANQFYVSKYHISHVFKENAGISLHQYLTKKRLNLCKNSIAQGNSPTKACVKYGFKDYSSFYRAFKKEYGYPPSEESRKLE